jgi:hypothetical protein
MSGVFERSDERGKQRDIVVVRQQSAIEVYLDPNDDVVVCKPYDVLSNVRSACHVGRIPPHPSIVPHQ